MTTSTAALTLAGIASAVPMTSYRDVTTLPSPAPGRRQARPPTIVSARLDDGDTLNQALIKVDQALCDSKHNGRNRCTYVE
ncbi:hypothetical protein [Pseudomonas sp. OTU5201]|uniref:hypothetical protein n=1 Tax=Pseudomonas sp. OTU5201 TaxID=3043850 RepID=UPI00313F2745